MHPKREPSGSPDGPSCSAANRLCGCDRSGEIEFVPEAQRDGLRVDGSPLTVAFEDPMLRAAGLGSDSYGEAVRFFGLSDREAHRLLCSCMNGWSMNAGTTAQRVERLAAKTSGGLLARFRALWSAMTAGAGAASPAR